MPRGSQYRTTAGRTRQVSRASRRTRKPRFDLAFRGVDHPPWNATYRDASNGAKRAAIWRAARRPSTAALMIPPAYPAPSPTGSRPATPGTSRVSLVARDANRGTATHFGADERRVAEEIAAKLPVEPGQRRAEGRDHVGGKNSRQIGGRHAPFIGTLEAAVRRWRSIREEIRGALDGSQVVAAAQFERDPLVAALEFNAGERMVTAKFGRGDRHHDAAVRKRAVVSRIAHPVRAELARFRDAGHDDPAGAHAEREHLGSALATSV